MWFYNLSLTGISAHRIGQNFFQKLTILYIQTINWLQYTVSDSEQLTMHIYLLSVQGARASRD